MWVSLITPRRHTDVLLWGLTRAKCIDVYSLILPELKDIGFFFLYFIQALPIRKS